VVEEQEQPIQGDLAALLLSFLLVLLCNFVILDKVLVEDWAAL